MRQGAPYSDSMRYYSTSNCKGPTAPSSGVRVKRVLELEGLGHALTQELIKSSPKRFPVAVLPLKIWAKHSGAKRGISLKRIFASSDRVSPIWKS